MITRIGTALLYVTDQEASLRFYRDLPGFSIVTDQDMGHGARWLELAPAEGATTMALLDAGQAGKQVGEGAHLTYACDDIEATVDWLRERGATVTTPQTHPWGTFAFIDGPDNHRVQIHQK